MSAAAHVIELQAAEKDLIDRIAEALPEEVRAEYYRELRHCRSLPENDEMLRLLRAMQFLVLLIEQAPSRIAVERAQLENVLTAAIANVAKMSAANETLHAALQKRLKDLPTDVAHGIRPEAVAARINETLQKEFARSAIPQTADALGGIASQMHKVCSEFSTASDNLGQTYRGAAEDARKAVASLRLEISQAAETAASFRSEVAAKFSRVYRVSLLLLAGGALVIGMSGGMMMERWLLAPPVVPVVVNPAPVAPHDQPLAGPTAAAKR